MRLDRDRCDVSLFISVVPDLTHANTFRFMAETNRTGLHRRDRDYNSVIYNGFITIPVCTNLFLETTVQLSLQESLEYLLRLIPKEERKF